MMDLHIPTLIVLMVAIVPLGLSIYFYVTKPGRGRLRVPTRAWLNPIGLQIVAQKVVLLLLFLFIWVSRLIGDSPVRQVIAWALYLLLAGAFWAFLIVQRQTQKPFEKKKEE